MVALNIINKLIPIVPNSVGEEGFYTVARYNTFIAYESATSRLIDITGLYKDYSLGGKRVYGVDRTSEDDNEAQDKIKPYVQFCLNNPKPSASVITEAEFNRLLEDNNATGAGIVYNKGPWGGASIVGPLMHVDLDSKIVPGVVELEFRERGYSTGINEYFITQQEQYDYITDIIKQEMGHIRMLDVAKETPADDDLLNALERVSR